MSQKMKFNPIVTRIKLNPEQAVLLCTCFSSGRAISTAGGRTSTTVCGRSVRENPRYNKTETSASRS